MNLCARPLLVAIGMLTALTCFASPAAAQETWSEFDYSELYLADLSAGPATYVAAFVAGEDGAITGEMASMRLVKFALNGPKPVSVKSDSTVAEETQLNRAILMNDSENTIVVYMQTATELLELRVFGGEGIAIGKLTVVAANEYIWGCRCVCDLGGGDVRKGILRCERIFPDHDGNSPCPCSSLNGEPCSDFDDAGGVLDGQMNGCINTFIPTPTGPGTGNDGGSGGGGAGTGN